MCVVDYQSARVGEQEVNHFKANECVVTGYAFGTSSLLNLKVPAGYRQDHKCFV